MDKCGARCNRYGNRWSPLTVTGVDRIWIVNVGDLKPMEYPIGFFMDMNPAQFNSQNLLQHTEKWCSEQLRWENAKEAARIINHANTAGGVRPSTTPFTAWPIIMVRTGNQLNYRSLALDTPTAYFSKFPKMPEMLLLISWFCFRWIPVQFVRKMYFAVAKQTTNSTQQCWSKSLGR